MHRADLHTLLLNAAAGAQIRMDRTVTGLEDDGDVVTAMFSDDTTERFDLVIGADGLNSTVRALVYGSAAPDTVYSGYTCWRFVAPCHEPLDGAVEMFGRGARAGIVPLTGDRAYVFLVADAPANAPGSSWAELEQRFSEFPPQVGRLIDSARTSGSPLLHHDLRDAERVVWGRGRIWLLGDAAHAPLPNLGQGAAMALEDALALAEALRVETSVTAAFERYVSLRHERTSVIWRDSRRLGRIAQSSGAAHQPPSQRAVRTDALERRPSSAGGDRGPGRQVRRGGPQTSPISRSVAEMQ
jgi:2-polyprenyl-6-methoxyphenol hydroxylase-like FAD-dependent oxidoreductase